MGRAMTIAPMPSTLWIVLSVILAIAIAVVLDMGLFSRKDHFPVEGRVRTLMLVFDLQLC